MPIYAYRCSACGHAKDVLQKLSDAPLTTCPACGADAFGKQVTAAGFQLKGSGWYVTDFRGGNSSGGGTAAAAATPAAEPAFYARKLREAATFDDELTASGTLACTGRSFHVLVCFFNADTLNEWRTPNTIALRLSGRGDSFYAWVEYATGKWRAGGDSPRSFPTARDPKMGRSELKGFAAKGTVHRWALAYDPAGNGGRGVVTATIDDEKAICHLDEGHIPQPAASPDPGA